MHIKLPFKRQPRIVGGPGLAVLTDPDLFTLVASYQDGLPNSLVHEFRRYNERLERLFYKSQPNLRARTSPALFRGYVLVKLLKEGDVDFALQLLRMCPTNALLLIPHRGVKYPVTMDHAVRARSLPLLASLHERELGTCTRDAMDIAAANGDLEIVQFLHEHRSEGCSSDAFLFAAKRGHTDVVTFLREYRPADEDVMPLQPHGRAITGKDASKADCVVQ
ncbi:hypothetical protein SDRG_12091 [Saprolegnia diclina VS20]|uniref:Uncharacterized protein n=1 Tax=Saprolegnia diclina (strain VS20) TaxID=1156394 RepID=T0Q6K2_SAPDV|nr:hypothetical protein SDRG_12091 [Saprolegnia diclina VS20]EQC30241.1 hypothetical protein SDRG_12091 [Saprolegnia diclina VS20]|eukprot:XP_008616373.1 hypothetical protein SDRG_12091 [Saprolegnia diclina VS20]